MIELLMLLDDDEQEHEITRDYLKELEKKEFKGIPNIDWTFWDELVEKTKKQIANYLKQNKPRKQRNVEEILRGQPVKTRYVYKPDGTLLAQGSAEKLQYIVNLPAQEIRIYSNNNLYNYKLNLYFSLIKHHQHIAAKIIEDILFKHGHRKRRTKAELQQLQP